MLIRIAGLVPESFVDGTGIRFAVFFQGCLRHCPACHNPHTHGLNGGKLFDTADIISQFKRNNLLDGITLTGGEPLLQIPPATELAQAAKRRGLSVWLYTGFTFEYLPADATPLIELVDVLVDGAFDINLRDLDLRFCGSRNQRLIDIQESLHLGKIVLWKGGIP